MKKEKKENITTENSDDSVNCTVCGKTNDKYIKKGETLRFKTNYCSNCGNKFTQNAQ